MPKVKKRYIAATVIALAIAAAGVGAVVTDNVPFGPDVPAEVNQLPGTPSTDTAIPVEAVKDVTPNGDVVPSGTAVPAS